MRTSTNKPVILAALIWIAFGRGTLAQDAVHACVTCTQPDRVYSCEVLPPETGIMAQSPQLFCAAEIGRNNEHTSCAVVRSSTTQCRGEQVTLAYTGPITEPSTTPVANDQETVQPTSDAPPKTLVEATDRAVKTTGKQIKNAGDAITATGKKVSDVTTKTGQAIKDTSDSIGNTVTKAAKSTWTCVVSLFQSC